MRLIIRQVSIAFFAICVSVCAIYFIVPKPPLLADIAFSRAVYDDQGHLLRLTLSRDEKYRLYTPLSKISAQVIATTLLQEDQYFRWHLGVNPISMIKAVWQTYFVKSHRMGASTITMQVARLRFNIHSKKIDGKILQILRALQLELFYSKNEILEAYLNLAPYGNNIEGVGAASRVYFDKSAKDLSLPEALTLSVIPQNPLKRTPLQKNLIHLRNQLFSRWIQLHPEDKKFQSTIHLPLQMQHVQDLPFIAPHFVNQVLSNAPSSQQEIHTTLNLHLQKLVEHVTKNYLSRKKTIGVNNAAVMIVDTRDMSVKALMGSGNFFDSKMGGQINGTNIKRSPGSTLKPFIYALALDQGLIHPNTMLKDVPRSFGNYNPENFDYDFLGPIKAKDALSLSRNIPAIYLANQLSHPNLYKLLQNAHVSDLKSEAYYGLALALGGAELSMQELVSLYAVLNNNGFWHPLRITKNDARTKGEKILSAEASFLILDMLKDENRSPSLSWKTGTSSGFRDAWTVGISGPYVIAVWLGHFDNRSNPALVGKNIAAPLLFELNDAIHQQMGVPAFSTFSPQLNLTQIPVCKASGMLPTRFCKETELTWFIPGKSPIKKDTIFREVAIDKNSGLRTCHFNQNTRFEIFEFWSSDLLNVFKQAGIQRRSPPPYDATCSTIQMSQAGLAPQITSPQTQLSYIFRASSHQKTLIPLSATTDADVQHVFWFINETFLTEASRDVPFLWEAKPGKFIIRVVDDHGRSDARDLFVRIE